MADEIGGPDIEEIVIGGIHIPDDWQVGDVVITSAEGIGRIKEINRELRRIVIEPVADETLWTLHQSSRPH